MSVFDKIFMWISDTGRVFRNEMKIFLHDLGVLLFFFALPFMYPVIYTLIYNPETVTKMPVAVVDDSRSAESRNFVQKASASPAIDIYAYCNDLQEARELIYENKVFGIIQIPSDYGKNIGRNDPAHVEFYADMSLLLRYRTFAAALTDLQLELISETTGERISAAGLNSLAQSMSMIQSDSNFLGDTEQGFASFIMPGIVILILQQSMLLGIGMLGGTSAERRRRNKGYDPLQVHGVGVTATVWGKARIYGDIYSAGNICSARDTGNVQSASQRLGNRLLYLYCTYVACHSLPWTDCQCSDTRPRKPFHTDCVYIGMVPLPLGSYMAPVCHEPDMEMARRYDSGYMGR